MHVYSLGLVFWRLENGMMSIDCACISHPLPSASIGMESKGDVVKLIAGAGQHSSRARRAAWSRAKNRYLT
jgi:hypothetical protein